MSTVEVYLFLFIMVANVTGSLLLLFEKRSCVKKLTFCSVHLLPASWIIADFTLRRTRWSELVGFAGVVVILLYQLLLQRYGLTNPTRTAFIWLADAISIARLKSPGGRRLGGLRNVLRWLLGEENCEHLDLARSDLRRDRLAMATRGWNPWCIRLWILLGWLRSITPILLHTCTRLLKHLAGAVKLVRQILGKG